MSWGTDPVAHGSGKLLQPWLQGNV
jgi:hypothetical protein